MLGEAVEATPGDAAAFAALAAVSAVSASTPPAVANTPPAPAAPAAPPLLTAPTAPAVPASPAGTGAGRVPPSGGAVAALATAGARIAAWEDAGWTNGWMADVAGREVRFQAALHRFTETSPRTAQDLREFSNSPTRREPPASRGSQALPDAPTPCVPLTRREPLTLREPSSPREFPAPRGPRRRRKPESVEPAAGRVGVPGPGELAARLRPSVSRSERPVEEAR
ncbi:hypothetical protein EDD96_5703 [Streptomyces sp. Ag109_G2-6]|uniref:hypothetical protein n=1 Tax=Streptomyces sp. Ag109_G2-6 TaxID=2485154 RepID=UPI000F500931|nr:hypothetical protein [Streptomyces sp. Ag109_G2-6]RPF29193.1 hypothetical protein EDD96_5703 [Streptomyces sp. Ag109_G2-6]